MIKVPTISLLLMGKNEKEYFLPAVISSAKTFIDEIVYIDTGSNDGTIEWLSENHPDVKVYHHPWVGWETSNKIRNFGISKCTSDYIMATDCDEVFGKDRDKIKPLLQKYAHIDAFHLEGRHYMYDMVHIDAHVPVHMWLLRLFKNNGKLFYPENQHGLVMNAESVLGFRGDFIHHYGHCKNMALALRRFDENIGEKNEFADKENRENYLYWQLLHMILGQFPTKRIKNLNEHPPEIQDLYHMADLQMWAERQNQEQKNE